MSLNDTLLTKLESSHVITDEIAHIDIVSGDIITKDNQVNLQHPFVIFPTCHGCDKILDGYIYRLTYRFPPYCSRLCFENNH